ncbi:NAD(P)H-dependent glycerol-3-phosphate dehydrogenase [Candidatus Dependentiae bacterium]|nr:NAD(P)H-dependent glycerol-3-phosphate dehydrogenase [Candidatus Dependentiae bacterium]
MTITILGEGAWATACASLLAHNGHTVTLWCRTPQVQADIHFNNKNYLYAPFASELSPLIKSTCNLQQAIEEAELIFQAIPVKFLRSVLEQAKPFILPTTRWVLLSKGIETTSLLVSSQILESVLGYSPELAILSGPSFAQEVIEKKFTAVMLASTNLPLSTLVKQLIQTSYFKTVSTPDILGVQAAAALKNCIALGAGFIQEAYASDNMRALFITQALGELSTLLKALGADASTLSSLAGLGDCILTAFSTQSRNTHVGKSLAQGITLAHITHNSLTIPESINTLQALKELANKYKLDLPLHVALYKLVYEKAHPSILHTALSDSLANLST